MTKKGKLYSVKRRIFQKNRQKGQKVKKNDKSTSGVYNILYIIQRFTEGDIGILRSGTSILMHAPTYTVSTGNITLYYSL